MTGTPIADLTDMEVLRAIVTAARKYDHDNRPKGNWASVPAEQVARLIIGALGAMDFGDATPAEQAAPDLAAACADLESEIRVAVSLHCTGSRVPCELCLHETDRAMAAVAAYARLVAEHERSRPAPELPETDASR